MRIVIQELLAQRVNRRMEMLEVKKTVAIKLKKMFLALGVGVCVSGMLNVPSYAAAKQVGTFEGHPLFDNQMSDVEITDGGTDSITMRGVSYAPKYDPRTIHMVSQRVEDQGFTNTCWSFATIAAIEANLIKKGYEDENVNLSENHLAYFFYNREKDPIGYTAGDKNLNTGSSWSMNGGTLYGTALSLATWSGVVKETSSEDDADGAYSPKALPKTDCYKSDYRVVNTYFYRKYGVNTVKQAIQNYGAVAIGIYMDDKYWNANTNAYNCNINAGNHAVTIVGWDDNYSRNNFKSSSRPTGNGAWIVKNSWGKGWGDEGYMYVSYEDKSLQEVVAFDMVPKSQSYSNNYQYDGTGFPAFLSDKIPSGTTFANVFKVKGTKAGYNEELKAVSVNVFTTNVRYSLQIYTGVTSGKNPKTGKAMFSKPQTGTLTNAGYNQIKLKTPVTLTAGEKYSVVIKLSTANHTGVQLGCEANYSDIGYKFEANVDSKQGYVYLSKKWYDAADYLGMNLRIKAYTDNTKKKTTYKLNNKSIGISKGSSAKLSVKTNPSSVKRKVTWSTSNKSVATVNSSGKVKAKGYGTATIKAKFVAGSKTKTLSCKVTVGPPKVQGFKVKGAKKKVTVTWKKNNTATGYEICYSKKKSSGYKTWGTVKKSTTTKFMKKKLKKGTYYVKMRPYLLQNGKKLYGSYTAVKTVKVK